MPNPYVDEIEVGGTTYDYKDKNAATKTELADHAGMLSVDEDGKLCISYEESDT